MTVYVKSGGAWRAAANGRLWIKSGGAWRLANYCHIKSGGQWRDSGYRGYPNPPSNLVITAWDFATVSVQFNGPAAGGAPVDHYEVVMTDSNQNPAAPIQAFNSNVDGTETFNVAADYRVAFFVRSVTASGLKSAWVAGQRAQIGHPEQGYWGSQLQQRGWSASQGFGGGLHRDEGVQFFVANSVVVTSRRFVFGLNFPGTYISWSAPNIRQVYYVNWSAQADLMLLNGHDVDFTNSDQFRGGDANFGFVIRGTGWSPVGNESQLLLGAYYMTGIEDYYVSVWVVTVAYVGNSLW